MMGTPSDELLRLYLSAGKPVIALGRAEALDLGSDEPIAHLARYPEPEELLRAVEAAARWPDEVGLLLDP
jgi:hypothetical protein